MKENRSSLKRFPQIAVAFVSDCEYKGDMKKENREAQRHEDKNE